VFSAQELGPFERALTLRRFEILRNVDPRLLSELAQTAEEHHFERGDEILALGKPVADLHLMVEGKVRSDGGEYDGVTLEPPAAIAPMSFLAGNRSDVEATAFEDTLTLALDRRAFEEVLADDPLFARLIARRLARSAIEGLAATLPGSHIVRLPQGISEAAFDPGWIGRLRYLQETGIFLPGNMDALMDVARRLEVVRFPAGATLWQMGDSAGWAVAIVAGTLRGVLGEHLEFTAGAGFQVGFLECLCDEPRWHDATAESDLLCLRSRPQELFDLIGSHPELTLEFVSLLARRVLDPTMWADEPAPVAAAPSVDF
jgi:CRP-like cAMP-binding protein